MNKTVITIHWRRVFMAVAAGAVLWLILVELPVHTFPIFVLILASSMLAAVLRIGWGPRTRAMSDVIDDVDAEASGRP